MHAMRISVNCSLVNGRANPQHSYRPPLSSQVSTTFWSNLPLGTSQYQYTQDGFLFFIINYQYIKFIQPDGTNPALSKQDKAYRSIQYGCFYPIQ